MQQTLMPTQSNQDAALMQDIHDLIPDADQWLNTGNTLFAGKKPIDFLGTEDEWQLRDAVGRIKYGLFS